jgi:hypothetical protein
MMKVAQKNIGRFNYFGVEFFKKNQELLVHLLNDPMLKGTMRYAFRVHKDIPFDEKISSIGPDYIGYNRNYSVVEGKQGFYETRDFRTHQKFSKRLYFAFKPLWYGMHYADEVGRVMKGLRGLERVPFWDFGLATLTAYPDPHPETTTVDGNVSRYAAGTWASLRGGAGNGFNDDATINRCFKIETDGAGSYYSLERSIFLFNTASIPDENIVNSGTLSVKATSKSNTFPSTAPAINVYASTPASNTALVAADYQRVGTTPFSSNVLVSAISTTVYTVFTLDAGGLAAIDVVGITKLGIREAVYDATNTSPGTPSAYYLMQCPVVNAETAGTSTDPKLVVEHSSAAPKTRKQVVIS